MCGVSGSVVSVWHSQQERQSRLEQDASLIFTNITLISCGPNGEKAYLFSTKKQSQHRPSAEIKDVAWYSLTSRILTYSSLRHDMFSFGCAPLLTWYDCFSMFRHQHFKTARRSFRTKNFAPQTCSCWPRRRPIFCPMLVPVPDTVDFTTEPMRHRCVSPWTCSLRSRSNLLRCDMCQEPIPSPGERSNQAEKTMYKCQGSERRKVVDIRTWCPVSCPRKMESVAPETLFGLFDGAQGRSEFDECFQIGAGTVSEKMRSPITFSVTVEWNTCFVGGTSKQQKNGVWK